MFGLNAAILAASVTLQWDAVIPVDIYTVYVGILPITATAAPLIAFPSWNTTYQVDGLDFGTTYFFVVTATFQSMESPYSNQVSYTPVPPTPTPTPTPTATPTPTPVPTPIPTPTPKRHGRGHNK